MRNSQSLQEYMRTNSGAVYYDRNGNRIGSLGRDGKLKNREHNFPVRTAVVALLGVSATLGMALAYSANPSDSGSPSAEAQSTLSHDKVTFSDQVFEPEFECDQVGMMTLNMRTPITWNLEGIRLQDSLDYAYYGRGTINVEACIDDTSKVYDEEASEKSGADVYKLEADDVTYNLIPQDDFENGLPKYDPYELFDAFKNNNPQLDEITIKQSANALVEKLVSYDRYLAEQQIGVIKSVLVENYGEDLYDATVSNATHNFKTQAKIAGKASNEAAIIFSDSNEEDIEFFTDTPKPPDDLPFEFLSESTEISHKFGIIKER